MIFEKERKSLSPNDSLYQDFLLEQYRQVHEQRSREVTLQWQLLGIGNTLLAGLIYAALTNSNPTISAILSGIAIPICFYIYVAYRKQVYFEDLFSDNIDAIEREITGLRHVQYDTFPQKEPSLYYIVKKPRKWSVEEISIHTVMTLVFGIFVVLSMALFYFFGSQIVSQPISIGLTFGIVPFFFILTLIVNRNTRIGSIFLIDRKKK